LQEQEEMVVQELVEVPEAMNVLQIMLD